MIGVFGISDPALTYLPQLLLVLQFICTNRRGRQPPTTTTTPIGLWFIALVSAFQEPE